MGIPSFFRWITRGPYRRKALKDICSGKSFRCDVLALDMNGLIHPCCHPEDEKQPKNEEEMIRNIYRYLSRIVKMLNPHTVLLAVDGVAPRAKMNQQRSRRFRSAAEAENSEQPFWDYCAITPGTTFMEKVSDCLRSWQKSQASRLGVRRCLVSDSTVPGEGEHKLMRWLRRNRPKGKVAVYGLDADLILLSLTSGIGGINLIREKTGRKGRPLPGGIENRPFQRMDTDVLFRDLTYHLAPSFNHVRQRSMNDFAMLCTLVGNDFLPHLPHVEIRKGSLDYLLRSYKRHFERSGGHLVSEDGCEIRWHRLARIMEDLCASVSKMAQGNRKRRRNGRYSQRPAEETRYYMEKLGWDGKNEIFIDSICEEYAKGLLWVSRYYHSKNHSQVPSWSWFYPHHYAPLTTDFCAYLSRKSPTFQFERDRPLRPMEQLLCVLSPKSSDLLPVAVRGLLRYEKSPLSKFYPRHLKTDLNGKRHAWQAVALLPWVDIESVKDEFKRVETKLDKSEQRRNVNEENLVWAAN